MAVQQGRSERRGEAYVSYVEPLSEARTTLADFFSILLGEDRVRASSSSVRRPERLHPSRSL
jgi:hypothetical protein